MLNFSKILICLMAVLFFSACTNDAAVINTGKMPGRTFGNIGKDKKEQSVKKSKNGIYIIRDEVTTNSAGVNFNINAGDQQVGPGDVRFDYEDFRTRY